MLPSQTPPNPHIFLGLIWPAVSHVPPHSSLPCSAVRRAGRRWDFSSPASVGFGQWREGRQGASKVRVFVLLPPPEGSPQTGSVLNQSSQYPSTQGQVPLSTHLCPSTFHTCSIPSPVGPRGGARASLSLALGSCTIPCVSYTARLALYAIHKALLESLVGVFPGKL